ncbi:MAG: cell wall hydrolase [Lachnospiraceae bacterium]|nr:cell wall hydrolase [Lachnospiraceae bacterium]
MNSFYQKCVAFAAIWLCLTAAIPGVSASASDDVSYKASLGSMAGTSADEDKKARFDTQEGVVRNRDAIFEAEHDSVKIKDRGFTKKDLKYMACVIYCEATSMTYEAKIAVGNVVLNRMYDTDPNGWAHVNTIKDVIYDRKWGTQFAVTAGKPSAMDKALELYKSMDPDKYKSWQIEEMNRAIEAAKDVLKGYKTIPDDFKYFNGYIEKSIDKCRSNGWAFTVMGMEDTENRYRHIYFGGKVRSE